MNIRDLSLAFETLLGEFNSQRVALEELKARGHKYADARLSEWKDPNHHSSPPAHVIHVLERACGKPIVSRAMLSDVMGVPVAEACLSVLASDATRLAADVNVTVALADADSIITRREGAEAQRAIHQAISQLSSLGQQISERVETDTGGDD